MIDQPDDVTGTPPLAVTDLRADLLHDVLGQIRLSGALFLRGLYSAPWGLDSPGKGDLIDLLAPGTERLLVFHTVRSGRMSVSAGGIRVELGAGELAVLPHADAHSMQSPDASTRVPIASLLPPTPWNEIPICEVAGGGEPAEIVCGYFRCNELLFNSLLRGLPPIFKVRPQGAVAALLSAAIDYALEDGSRNGGITALAHLTEMLLAEALKLYAAQASEPAGWLAATADPVVGRALKLIHDAPQNDWSVDELARSANTSRSVLGERFRALLDQSPIRYLAEWRMQVAAGLLRTTDMKVADVAERAGYGSEAAFSRAFHRHIGAAPAQWRDRF
jgi:AraC-like DNA-binding protein